MQITGFNSIVILIIVKVRNLKFKFEIGKGGSPQNKNSMLQNKILLWLWPDSLSPLKWYSERDMIFFSLLSSCYSLWDWLSSSLSISIFFKSCFSWMTPHCLSLHCNSHKFPKSIPKLVSFKFMACLIISSVQTAIFGTLTVSC